MYVSTYIFCLRVQNVRTHLPGTVSAHDLFHHKILAAIHDFAFSAFFHSFPFSVTIITIEIQDPIAPYFTIAFASSSSFRLPNSIFDFDFASLSIDNRALLFFFGIIYFVQHRKTRFFCFFVFGPTWWTKPTIICGFCPTTSLTPWVDTFFCFIRTAGGDIFLPSLVSALFFYCLKLCYLRLDCSYCLGGRLLRISENV